MTPAGQNDKVLAIAFSTTYIRIVVFLSFVFVS